MFDEWCAKAKEVLGVSQLWATREERLKYLRAWRYNLPPGKCW